MPFETLRWKHTCSSRLERERDAALAVAAPRVAARSSLPAAAEGPGLGEDLRTHTSRLERERDAALAAAAPRVAPRSARSSAQEEPLELKQHKSRLELERDAALAAAAPRVSAGRSARSSTQEEAAAPLELKQRKSRLELEREAALAVAEPRIAAGRSARSSVQEGEAAQGGLADDFLVHKSRLELEQEAAKAAAAAGEAVTVKADASSRRASSSGHEAPLELALGSRRLSRLEQEQAAAKAAAENMAAGLGGAPPAGGAAPKTRLQLEKEAAAKAEKARAAAALLAKARAAAAAKAGGSLGEALKPTSPSKLQQESTAWRRAVRAIQANCGQGQELLHGFELKSVKASYWHGVLAHADCHVVPFLLACRMPEHRKQAATEQPCNDYRDCPLPFLPDLQCRTSDCIPPEELTFGASVNNFRAESSDDQAGQRPSHAPPCLPGGAGTISGAPRTIVCTHPSDSLMLCVAWLQAGACCWSRRGAGGSSNWRARRGCKPVPRLQSSCAAGLVRTPCGELLLRAPPPPLARRGGVSPASPLCLCLRNRAGSACDGLAAPV